MVDVFVRFLIDGYNVSFGLEIPVMGVMRGVFCVGNVRFGIHGCLLWIVTG